jgi:hypothetical protein
MKFSGLDPIYACQALPLPLPLMWSCKRWSWKLCAVGMRAGGSRDHKGQDEETSCCRSHRTQLATVVVAYSAEALSATLAAAEHNHCVCTRLSVMSRVRGCVLRANRPMCVVWLVTRSKRWSRHHHCCWFGIRLLLLLEHLILELLSGSCPDRSREQQNI